MTERYRRCAKCGSSSQEDPSLVLYRFPGPGKKISSILKAKIWAYYCFPNEECSSLDFLKNLHNQSTVLCSKHFDGTAYADVDRKKLKSFAFPYEAQNIYEKLLQTTKGIAKWSHIEEFYKKDNNASNFVFAPALTKQHIQPHGKQKMKVKLAAQVFSHSVAAGLHAKISQGELPAEATATAMVVNLMDQLFDSVNGDTADRKNGKKYLTNLSRRSPHFIYFEEMKKFFSTISFLGARARPPSLDGWIRTLNGFKRLFLNLEAEGYGSLCTRRISQDPLENCFGCIRGNCGFNDNPTTTQFISSLKTAMVSNLLRTSKGNCQDDDNVILDDLKRLLTSEIELPTEECSNEQQAEFSVNCSSSQDLQACAYVCGFIIKKKYIMHKMYKHI